MSAFAPPPRPPPPPRPRPPPPATGVHTTRWIPAVVANGSGAGRQSADVFGIPPPPRPATSAAAADDGSGIRECRDDRAAGVEDLERHRPGRVVLGSSRSSRRSAGSAPAARPSASGVPLSPPCMQLIASAGLKRYASAASTVVVDLAQRADVVDHPEAAAVRRDDQIVAVDLEVAHRRRPAGSAAAAASCRRRRTTRTRRARCRRTSSPRRSGSSFTTCT